MSDELVVLRDQIGRRPNKPERCPRCLRTDGEVLPSPVTKCEDCAHQDNPQHTALHTLKVCWSHCHRCNLVFSGTANEHIAEAPIREPQPLAGQRPRVGAA